MANWIEPTEADLAANLSQGEIDAFRRDGALDGTDPVAPLLGRFVEGQLATCARLGVPCLDLYHRSGITAENAEHLTEADRLHPNEAAYAMVKDLQVEFLRNCL